jgi:hypothetical protein
MSTIQDMLMAALMADAAYVEVPDVVPGTGGLSGDDLTRELQNGGRLTETEAELISSQYDLVASTMDSGVGFHALVFQKHGASGQPGEFVLAIRGTELTCGHRRRHCSGAGRCGGWTGRCTAAVRRSACPSARTGRVRTTTSPGSLDATGHSLGGHLVQALVSAQPSLIHAGYTQRCRVRLNLTNPAANVALALQAAWLQFGGVATKVTNVIGEAGLDIVPSALTGAIVGDIRELFTESQTLPLDDHSMGILVDSLMVYRAFETLAGTAQFDMATVTDPAGGQQQPAGSLETAVNWLVDAFQNINTGATTVLYEDRPTLHRSASQLTTYLAEQPPGTFTLTTLLAVPTSSLVVAASQDDAEGLAYRYALVKVPLRGGRRGLRCLFNSSPLRRCELQHRVLTAARSTCSTVRRQHARPSVLLRHRARSRLP